MSVAAETHVDAIGLQAFGGNAPMQRDTIFRIASMTKPVTSVAVMMLLEEGRLRLDDPVAAHLPGFDQFLQDNQVISVLELDGRAQLLALEPRRNGPSDHGTQRAKPTTS